VVHADPVPAAEDDRPLDDVAELADGQGMTTKGLSARPLREWMALASTPFPVPLSPVMRTVASAAATCRPRSSARSISGLELRRSASNPPCFRVSWSPCTSCSRLRIRATLLVTAERWAGVKGFGR
jgi:hypothetical protein